MGEGRRERMSGLLIGNDRGQRWMRLENGLPAKFDVLVQQIVLDEAGAGERSDVA